jgi:hypothetical protein
MEQPLEIRQLLDRFTLRTLLERSAQAAEVATVPVSGEHLDVLLPLRLGARGEVTWEWSVGNSLERRQARSEN